MAMSTLPLSLNLCRAEGNCDLGAVMSMSLPEGAMLFSGVKAVIVIVLRNIFAGGTRLEANQELLVSYRWSCDLWV
jgi:hypothetical protein